MGLLANRQGGTGLTVRTRNHLRLLSFITTLGLVFALAVPAALADHVDDLTLSPDADTAVAGTCNAFTIDLTGDPQTPDVSGQTVDVLVQDTDSDDPSTPSTNEARSPVAFCTPPPSDGPNPRPTNTSGVTSSTTSCFPGFGCFVFPYQTLNNDGNCETTGDAPGCDGDLQGETGPTDQNGIVTFGIVSDQAGHYDVTAFYDENDDEYLGGTEENDTSAKTFIASSRPAQCSDGVDNDGDGKTDFPADPQCASSSDNDESQAAFQSPPSQCSDGVDNDGDTKTDYPADAQCTSAADNDESQSDFQPECNDGIDNDGDGAIDHPADVNCDSAGDQSEAAPVKTHHARSAKIRRFRHIRLPGSKHAALLVKGNVTVNDGYSACRNSIPVKVQIRAGGEWITRKSDTTDQFGTFKVLIRDIAAKYRVVAPKFLLANQSRNEVDVCGRAQSPTRRHRHVPNVGSSGGGAG
jgi:hypothetical protein